MKHTFYSLPINYIHYETSDSVIIGFDTSGTPSGAFDFIAGQNITVKFNHNGEELRRTYSICSAPHEKTLKIGVRAIPNGIFSNLAMTSLNIGDKLDVMTPNGHFTAENPSATYVFFAVGSGITPILSMIKTILHRDHTSQCVLFYGNKRITSMMFRDEIDALKNKYLTRFQIIHTFTQQPMENDLFVGRLTRDKCTTLINTFIPVQFDAQFFICGPEEFTLQLKSLLIDSYLIPSTHVHFELFHTGLMSVDKKEVEILEGEKSIVTVKLDGKEITFPLGYQGENILDAGIRHGLDLPFSCKGGVCSTCKAKIVQGSAQMDINYSLEADEIAAGFILSCQAHPCSEEVYIDFDC